MLGIEVWMWKVVGGGCVGSVVVSVGKVCVS